MNILIIKIGALGDVLRTTLLAQALKDKYKSKNPQIYWITDKKAIPFFINNPYVTKVLEEEKSFILNDTPFDIIINLEEDKKSCALTSSLKPKQIIGAYLTKEGEIDYTKESAYWFDTSRISKLGEEKADKLKIVNKKTHRQILCEMIGVQWKKYEPFFRLTSNQRKLRESFLRRHNLSMDGLIIGINSGAADRWPKSLPINKTVKLINSLYKKYKATILLFGGPNEIERNKEIHKLTKTPIIDTGCGNDLIEFPALISACNFFVTTDSLGMHIALALKRKTIVFVGPTSPHELDMYGLGEKIVAKSKYVSTYRLAPKNIMDKIRLEEAFKSIDLLLRQKVMLVITAFKEPNIGKTIESAINQKTRHDYDILVSAPDKETLDIAREYAKEDKRIKLFQDSGKGKSYALNMLFEKLDSDILLLTDGDVYLSDNAVEELVGLFSDPEIGCATGRPTPIEDKKSKYGYWANFLFEAAHCLRKKSFEKHGFIECSGYLFAFRKKMITRIPLDVAEDSVIPYFFWQRGYRIGYAENARVYVKNPENIKDWMKQKTRTSKAHETLEKYVDTQTTKRVKTFATESRGIGLLFTYPNSLREIKWTVSLIFARLYMWAKVFYDTKLKRKHYADAWERVESTK